MNAGAHGSDMSEILVKAHILFEDGTIEWLTNEQMDFSYRTSVLQKKRPGVCLEAVLRLEQKDKESIVQQMQSNKDYRKIHSRIQALVREAYSEIRFRIMPGTL